MPNNNNLSNLLTYRKSLDQVCKIPEKIISVYTLEQHIWEQRGEATNRQSRALRKPVRQTVEEFQIQPVRPFLNDILRMMAAPYRPERRDEPIGQGYWIQAEFGSGKSHLLCFLSTLALGDEAIWDLVRQKEAQAGRGRRESLYQFWEEGLRAKSEGEKRGILVVAKTLVGTGSSAVGNDDTQRLLNYILDAVREQIYLELGKNISLYPVELLADRFLDKDHERYRADLRRFLRDPRFFEEDEFEEIDDFMGELQSNKAPEYKRNCGNKLWRFYNEYLGVRPNVETDTETVLKHMVETVLAEGYSGLLLVLDEVSIFMKGRNEQLRTDDEQTLLVLSNRLTRVHNLPIWTVCAAQQAIENQMSEKNIIANDRLKMVPLLGEGDEGYYDIVLARVREIIDPDAISGYYLYYKTGFSWTASISEDQFRRFFPFHKPALEVLRPITYKLTSQRSAIHFMYQTLKRQIELKKDSLISLWQLFDETVNYEEDPSGVHAGIASIRTSWESEFKIYEACKQQINTQTNGPLKVYREKAGKILQSLLLYHLSLTRQQGVTPEELANAVLDPRDSQSGPQENNEHYRFIASKLSKELRQIVEVIDDENNPRYRFDPVFTGIDPRREFGSARSEVESSTKEREEAWSYLLGFTNWSIRTRHTTFNVVVGSELTSLFHQVAPSQTLKEQEFEIEWQNRRISGIFAMRDLLREPETYAFSPLESDRTDHDFAVHISTRPLPEARIQKLLTLRNDPRILLWTPAELNNDELSRLHDLAAYRRLLRFWENKDSDDAFTMVQWIAKSLQSDISKIVSIVRSVYGRGRIDGTQTSRMDFDIAGNLKTILTPVIGRALTAAYEARDIKFGLVPFTKEDGVKVINGIVRVGEIDRYAKSNKDISAVQNFGYCLGIVKKTNERKLDIENNRFVQDIYRFIESKQGNEGQPLKIETIYKNFMGIGNPSYGLSRRMIQIYLLGLVQTGKIKIGLSTKAGLSFSAIDYSNIKGIDFSARILDALTEVQKMTQPKNWEVLRPFAEVLLNEELRPTHDDALITSYRRKLRDLIQSEKEQSKHLRERAQKLFAELDIANPYEHVLEQFTTFFAVENAEEIDPLLLRLQTAFVYAVFDTGEVQVVDIDDLRNRYKQYRNMQAFLSYEMDLRTAYAYCTHPLPESPDLNRIRQGQQLLGKKLQDIQRYIDSEPLLRTELIGKEGKEPLPSGEIQTLNGLIQEYSQYYSKLHNDVFAHIEQTRDTLLQLARSRDLEALHTLEQITALQPRSAETLKKALQTRAFHLPTCNASRPEIEMQLKSSPVHRCGLTFENYHEKYWQEAEYCEEEAQKQFDETIEKKMTVFLNPAVRERLQQGAVDERIVRLLNCTTGQEVRTYLIEECLRDARIVETIKRYLKLITVKKISLSGFKPSRTMVEREQIELLVDEFKTFLQSELEAVEKGNDDTLPMLQLE